MVMDAIRRKKWTHNKSDNSILSYKELELIRVLCSTDSGPAGTRDKVMSLEAVFGGPQNISRGSTN